MGYLLGLKFRYFSGPPPGPRPGPPGPRPDPSGPARARPGPPGPAQRRPEPPGTLKNGDFSNFAMKNGDFLVLFRYLAFYFSKKDGKNRLFLTGKIATSTIQEKSHFFRTPQNR